MAKEIRNDASLADRDRHAVAALDQPLRHVAEKMNMGGVTKVEKNVHPKSVNVAARFQVRRPPNKQMKGRIRERSVRARLLFSPGHHLFQMPVALHVEPHRKQDRLPTHEDQKRGEQRCVIAHGTDEYAMRHYVEAYQEPKEERNEPS